MPRTKNQAASRPEWVSGLFSPMGSHRDRDRSTTQPLSPSARWPSVPDDCSHPPLPSGQTFRSGPPAAFRLLSWFRVVDSPLNRRAANGTAHYDSGPAGEVA